MKNKYEKLAEHMVNKIIEMNNSGNVFPLFASCQGIHFISLIIGKSSNIIQTAPSFEMVSLDGNHEDIKNSKLYKFIPEELFDKYLLKMEFAVHHHQFGIKVKDFQNNDHIKSFFKILTTNKDLNGEAYISSMEGRNYPFYLTQFHPEVTDFWNNASKNDFDVGLTIVFNASILASFLDDANKNTNQFTPADEGTFKILNVYNEKSKFYVYKNHYSMSNPNVKTKK